MALTVQALGNQLVRSRLLAPEDLKPLEERWRAEAKDSAGDLPHFTRWLVAHDYATEYQVGALVRGHTGDFQLDEYKILERIGKGRMAGVFKASHRLGQTVAVKVLPVSKAKDAEVLARFQREARLAVRLKHPNVVRTFQIGHAGVHYLVMEYLEGETLEDVLQRRSSLPPAEAVRVLYQALEGLQHLHEEGLVHRDLKPANLMLVPARARGAPDTTLQATVKILDIGLGRALFDENAPADTEALTAAGVILGDPRYLSPEQAKDSHQVDIRTDIYSLGCVLYHALTGQPPFPDNNPVRQMVRHATEAPRPLTALNPAVSKGLERVVLQMLTKDPAQRYPTPERAARALKEYLSDDKAEASDEPTPEMQSYLTWLEKDAAPESKKPGKPVSLGEFNSWASLFTGLLPTKKDTEESFPPPPSPPRRTPVPPADVGHGAKHSPPRTPRSKFQPEKTKRTEPLPAAKSSLPRTPIAPSAERPAKRRLPDQARSSDPDPAETADVELVSMTSRKKDLGSGMSRRDLLLVGLGVGIGVGTALTAGAAAWLFTRLRAQRTEASEGLQP